ncbi:ABC transporter permease [Brachybacterium saurashtrense]|uniref:ABC transporter permease subunit n=1 Tax=Brachybacterium saurashtrense TaxID=556288 RepID=A0A345YPM6_9MICO|nr:ABC transporter permease subunit [Brachybacterium saurashtrense]AXK45878.1 ABC transporter permease subunit [Brachybacterium saurashtrense]RRR24897.1 ABC transporter permease subunit [Brachybacterium saurashtrense]
MNPDDGLIPRIPVGEWAESGIDWLKDNVSWLFDAFSWVMRLLVENLTDALLWPPALVLIPLFALLAWVVRSWKLAIGTLVMMLAVVAMDQWEPMLQTMALVIVATACAVVVAVPLGILAAMSSTVSAIVKPVMDFMQTMPAFVYLIPAVTFFSIGLVPGIFSTIVFALPPGVRMTELGIRQVDHETVEAGESFGASRWQILRGIQLPLAVPTIMAGVNQVIMLALSMAVIAGMTGVDGSGKLVVQAISTLDLPLGVEAGLGVVALAVFLDRLTAALGNPGDYRTSLIALVKRRRAAARS